MILTLPLHVGLTTPVFHSRSSLARSDLPQGGSFHILAGNGRALSVLTGRAGGLPLIYTYDQGWTDLGIHGVDPEVRTPHLDQLAREGALFMASYSTTPQCVPARAGLIAATTVAVASAAMDDRIEGANLMPWLIGERTVPVHDSLYWRWRSQAAIFSGDWKFIHVGDQLRYLFEMTEMDKQTAADNKIDEFLGITARLEQALEAKADTWTLTGLPEESVDADLYFLTSVLVAITIDSEFVLVTVAGTLGRSAQRESH